MTRVEELAEYLVGPLPIESVECCVRLHLVDTALAWVVASRTTEGRKLLDHHRRSPGTVADRVALRCALARLSEIDDIHLGSCVTPGSMIVPAVLTLAVSVGATSEATAAIVAGYEAMVRVGRTLGGPDVLARRIWPTYLVAPVGVAAAGSRLLGLDRRQTADAVSMAAALAAPGVGRQSGKKTSRWLAVGHAARSGVCAVEAVRSGFTADRSILDGDFIASVYGIASDSGALTAGLGASSAIDGVSFKPWCAARQTMAAAQGVRELLVDGAPPTDIGAIEVGVPPHLQEMVDHGVVAGDRETHLTSIPYQVASAVVAPQAMFDVEQSPPALPPGVRSMMSKVTVVPDPSLLAQYPDTWPTRVTVTTGAEERELMVTDVPGDPGRPFTTEHVGQKCRQVGIPVLGEDATEVLLETGLVALSDPGGCASLLSLIECLTNEGTADDRSDIS